jgi:hypothetical protein
MSDIDFQNGFICGMATKGLIKTVSQGESFPMVVNIEPLSLETSSIIANMTIGEVILL